MTRDPALSVFMPVYNAEPYLREAIESVLNQTFSDFEFLIVDDGSTDGSVAVIESFRDDRIRLIRQENQGCYPARNRAIREARGTYLASMDADDISLPERFARQIAYVESHERVDLVGTRAYECDREDSLRLPRPEFFSYRRESEAPWLIDPDSLGASAPFTLPTILFRRTLVDRIGAYDERLRFGADLDFVARVALAGTIACLPEYLYVLRASPSSISASGSDVQREVAAILFAVTERTRRGVARQFTESEIRRLEDLADRAKRAGLMDSRHKAALYENRLATLYRVNGRYQKAMIHTLRALRMAPTRMVLERKFLANVAKAWFGLRPTSGPR